jgi:hypothetical protein
MMLKVGICSIGMSLGVAIFIPRHEMGLFSVLFLLVTGMVLVLASPRLRTDDGGTSLAGPEGTIRRSEPGVRHPAIRGKHSKEETTLDDSTVTPLKPRD